MRIELLITNLREDGIIRYLIDNIKISNNSFVEFGVEDYEESNTRLLL